MSRWPVILLVIAASMLFRWQGEAWPVTVAKLEVLTGIVLAGVTTLGNVIARVG